MNKATLPIDPNTTRKDYPLYSGLLAYFPNALAYVSYVSKKANDQHNPGEPLHWARDKSTDHLDCLMRHLARAGERDEDGLLESGKVAWRALAQLETELEQLKEQESHEAVDIKWRRDVPFTAPTLFCVEPAQEKPKTLYDWSKAPNFAKWAALDHTGIAYWYEYKPSLINGSVWDGNGGWVGRVSSAAIYFDGKAADSLEARPT